MDVYKWKIVHDFPNYFDRVLMYIPILLVQYKINLYDFLKICNVPNIECILLDITYYTLLITWVFTTHKLTFEF